MGLMSLQDLNNAENKAFASIEKPASVMLQESGNVRLLGTAAYDCTLVLKRSSGMLMNAAQSGMFRVFGMT